MTMTEQYKCGHFKAINRAIFEAHNAHFAASGRAVPCGAHHVNYGGDCLNCGFDPRRIVCPTCNPKES